MRRLMLLLLIACRTEPPGGLDRPRGDVCIADYNCVVGLRCVGGKCESPQAAEESMRQQSGLPPRSEVGAPAPVTAPVARGAVKMRKATGTTPVFAACADDERLVGGGCSGGDLCFKDCPALRTYPSSADDNDTLGGKWNCEGPRGSVTAHALCQR